jgi:hypothetical protein
MLWKPSCLVNKEMYFIIVKEFIHWKEWKTKTTTWEYCVGKESETWTCSMSLLHLCAPLYYSSFDQSMQKKRLCEIKTTSVSFLFVFFLSMSIVFSQCGCCPKCLCCVVKHNSMEKELETFNNWKKVIIVLTIRRFFKLNSF